MTRRRKVAGWGEMAQLQLRSAQLGLRWMELCGGAAAVIAWRSAMLGAAMLRPTKLADPEFALMVTEKVAAASEAAERASRRALRRRRRSSAAAGIAEAIGAAESCLQPFGRRVRANARRLGRTPGA